MEQNRQISKIDLRTLQMSDYDQLAGSFHRIYADHDVFWTHEQIKKLITIFPEGQVVIIADDKIVHHRQLQHGEERPHLRASNRQ